MISVNPASLINEEVTLRETLMAIDSGEHGIAFVVDADQCLIGILTQYEVRKALLGGVGLDELCRPFINRQPVVADIGMPREDLKDLVRRSHKLCVPLIDNLGRLVGLETADALLDTEPPSGRLAVVVAGGRGTRLAPLTRDLPKPMLSVGEKPILQIIIEQLRRYGFTRIFIAVNFKSELIETFLKDGTELGVQINYLREELPLGTAGGLTMLPERPTEPFLVMNGDLLTRVNFADILEYHHRSGEKLTMCVRRYSLELPYGVVQLAGARITDIVEKPIQSWFVNAGIYVLEPEVLDLLPASQSCDMPELANRAIERWNSIGAFPIHEYWLDVGRPNDFVQAIQDYPFHFK